MSDNLPDVENVYSTPMMKQYLEIKSRYPDCILFYRLGDFYEMFMEDAKIGAQVLDIALTSRDRGKDGRIPMSGIPFHAVESYLSKLVRAGYKVAICEQLSDPAIPGLVQRDVVRIVTSGTLMDENTLEKKENNFIFAVHVEDGHFGLAIADISTGYFETAEHPLNIFENVIVNELAKYNPSECVLPPILYNDAKILKIIKSHKSVNIFPFFEWDSAIKDAYTKLTSHFKIKSLEPFGIDSSKYSIKASAGLLSYLKYTQKGDIRHIKKISTLDSAKHMILDRSTIYNLELFSTLRDTRKKGSLIDYLDHTVSPMGGRLLRLWLMQPLVTKELINSRYDAVTELIKDPDKIIELSAELSQVMDIERLLSRLSVGIGNPRDMVNLKNSLITVRSVKAITSMLTSDLFKEITLAVSSEALSLVEYISKHIENDPPFDPKSGGYIKTGVNADLDTLRKSIHTSKEYVSNLEISEKKRTGINSLKVRYNQVFGYYIEITKSNLNAVPDNYIRKQTMVNAERYITPELKEHEEKILAAEEQIKEIEYKVFQDVITHVLTNVEALQAAAQALAVADCISCFANLACTEQLVRPELVDEDVINIVEGRHPVVELAVGRANFVPNDVLLNKNNNQLLIITGPNMAGKSVYIRQTAVIVLMAQMGCFIPAKKAQLCITDKIFVRSGASDFISGGLSTFMVEMMETANILNSCTNKSLIVMDEIGRGTSTYDGISIAWSVAEYLVTSPKIKAKTLFATHYHELQELQEKFPNNIKNYQVLVQKTAEGPVFLHRVVEGAANHSYGIDVARLAGVPDEVSNRAVEIMAELSTRSSCYSPNALSDESTVLVKRNDMTEFTNKLGELDISMTTPLDALNILAELKQIWDRNSTWEK